MDGYLKKIINSILKQIIKFLDHMVK